MRPETGSDLEHGFNTDNDHTNLQHYGTEASQEDDEEERPISKLGPGLEIDTPVAPGNTIE